MRNTWHCETWPGRKPPIRREIQASAALLLLLCYAPMSFALDRASRQNKELPASIT